MRPRSLLLLTLPLLTACGFSAGGPSACAVDGLQVEADEEIDCTAVARNVALARELTDWLPEGYTVQIRNDFAFEIDDSGKMYDGYWTSDPRHITLTRDGRSLAHEFLHDFEWRHGVRNTGEHPDWEGKSFYRISSEFKQRAEGF